MDRQRLEQALIAADAAGDTDAARQLAAAIRGLTTSPPEEPIDPTADMTPLQRAAAGAGKFLADIGRGAPQAAWDMFAESGMGRISGADQFPVISEYFRKKADEAKALDAPLMATTAGKVGNIGGGVVFGAPLAFIPGANTYAGAALTGAGLGAVQPVGTDDSRALNTGLGAVGGVAGKYVGDKLSGLARVLMQRMRPATSQAAANVAVGPSASGAQAAVQGSANLAARGGGSTYGSVGDDVSAGLTAAEKQAAEAGKQLGMRQTPGQATGSRALQQMEAKLESQPMTSGPFNRIKKINQNVVNREWAKMIGETGESLDSTVLQNADDRLGKVFESVRDERPRTIDPSDFVQRMRDVSDEFEAIGPQVWKHPLVQRLVSFAENGAAKGKDLGSLTSKLGREASKQMTTQAGDRDLGRALYQVKDYVDDLVAQGLGADELAQYTAARTQYRNLMLLTQRVGVVNPSTGNVSALNLANVLQQKDKSGYLFGGNQSAAYNALRFAQAFKPIVGDSGTATRSMINSPLDLLFNLPINLMTRAYTSSPAVNASVAAQSAAQNAGSVTAPLLQGLSPYLPVTGGILGIEAARQ
jgi:hypothetical protein